MHTFTKTTKQQQCTDDDIAEKNLRYHCPNGDVNEQGHDHNRGANEENVDEDVGDGEVNEQDHAQNGGANKQGPNNEDRGDDNEQNDD
ncbi:hypothetical protein H5410_017231 [Solanum commersonii]|uniref:Uncharacterized protein n=1 Tax=Solanum commersonii TaxID=4109 RepID=A0A9J5ZZY1_SOLCO|nr:hypothetical protein H5410_017231 [Solanum commersonii]